MRYKTKSDSVLDARVYKKTRDIVLVVIEFKKDVKWIFSDDCHAFMIGRGLHQVYLLDYVNWKTFSCGIGNKRAYITLTRT